jgi:hypothetical protein
MKAIDRYFAERNRHYTENPKRACFYFALVGGHLRPSAVETLLT